MNCKGKVVNLQLKMIVKINLKLINIEIAKWNA